MKKLLVLILVLAMTSAVFAAGTPVLQIWVNGTPWQGGDVLPSDIITVAFLETEGAIAAPMGSNFLIEMTNGDYEDQSLYVYESTSIGDVVLYDDENPGFGVGASGNTMWGTGALLPTEGELEDIVFMFDFHVPWYKVPSDWIYINTMGSYGQVDRTDDELLDAAIHVVPEPMTIALLGLGGLFLVRRRKK